MITRLYDDLSTFECPECPTTKCKECKECKECKPVVGCESQNTASKAQNTQNTQNTTSGPAGSSSARTVNKPESVAGGVIETSISRLPIGSGDAKLVAVASSS